MPVHAAGIRRDPPGSFFLVSENEKQGFENGLTNVSSHPDRTTLHHQQSRLTTRAATTGCLSIPRIQRAAKNVVDGFGNHHGCGHIGLDVKHGTCFL